MYPDGYTNETGFPNLRDNEHFQVWMRIAALPTFRKLWARNDQEVMKSGKYTVIVYMSKNPFLSVPMTWLTAAIKITQSSNSRAPSPS